MSGLFGGSPKPQQPDPELVAAQERQEQKVEAEDRDRRMKLAAQRRARYTGGRRMLLSKTREDAEKGITETLGPV
jgi:hypothetical protein